MDHTETVKAELASVESQLYACEEQRAALYAKRAQLQNQLAVYGSVLDDEKVRTKLKCLIEDCERNASKKRCREDESSISAATEGPVVAEAEPVAAAAVEPEASLMSL